MPEYSEERVVADQTRSASINAAIVEHAEAVAKANEKFATDMEAAAPEDKAGIMEAFEVTVAPANDAYHAAVEAIEASHVATIEQLGEDTTEAREQREAERAQKVTDDAAEKRQVLKDQIAAASTIEELKDAMAVVVDGMEPEKVAAVEALTP